MHIISFSNNILWGCWVRQGWAGIWAQIQIPLLFASVRVPFSSASLATRAAPLAYVALVQLIATCKHLELAWPSTCCILQWAQIELCIEIVSCCWDNQRLHNRKAARDRAGWQRHIEVHLFQEWKIFPFIGLINKEKIMKIESSVKANSPCSQGRRKIHIRRHLKSSIVS